MKYKKDQRCNLYKKEIENRLKYRKWSITNIREVKIKVRVARFQPIKYNNKNS